MGNIIWQHLLWNSIIFTGYYKSLLLCSLIFNFPNFLIIYVGEVPWQGLLYLIGTIPAATLILKYACLLSIQQRLLFFFQICFLYKSWHMFLQYLRVLYTWKKDTTFYLKKQMYGFKFQGFHFYCLLVVGFFLHE